jgi:hypothetical protein
MLRRSITLTLLLLALWTSQSFAAGRVFYDGFEATGWNGTTQGWFNELPTFPLPTIVATALDGKLGPKAGTKMARFQHPAASDSFGYDDIGLHTENMYTDEILIRAWYRHDDDLDIPGVNSTKKIFRIYGNPVPDLLSEIKLRPGLTNEYTPTVGNTKATYSGSAPGDNSVSNDSWHKLEYYIRNSTGTCKVWYDGILVRNDTGDAMAGKFGPFFPASNFHDAHDNANHVYFDEVEVFSDTGTGGTGLMSNATITQGGGDITPPSVPTNLRVVSVVTNAVTLAWDASTDDTAVTGYFVEHCAGVSCAGFIQVGAPVSLTFNDSGILTNTSYSFRVRATDAASNLSSYSSTLTQATDTVKFELTFKFRRVVSEIREFFHSFFSPWVQMAANQGGLS